MRQHYDVAVVGGQTAGLIAAALLAKRGRRVVLLDHGENTSYYRRKGLRLPLVPTLVPALDSAPHVQKVHAELGLGPDLRAASTALDPVFQAVMPKHRIDVVVDRQALLDELRAEFPELAEPTKRFFERLFALDDEITSLLANSPPLPPNGLSQRLRARALVSRSAHLDAPFESHDLLAGIPADHPLRDVLLGPLSFFGHLPSEEPSTLHAVRLIARYYRGTVGFADGVGGLHAMLTKAALQAGVEIRKGAVVRELRTRRSQMTGVDFVDGKTNKQTCTADFFVASTLSPFQELLPPSKQKARYTVDQQAVRPSGSLLVLNLVVSRQVIPRGMGRALFLLNGRRQARGEESSDPPLLLRRYPAQRGEPSPVRGTESIDDAEHEILSVACPVRTADVARSPEALAGFKAQMLERVGRVVPFLRNFVVDVSLPVDPSSWEPEDDSTARRVDPWTLHPIFDPAERPMLGVAARSTKTPYRNLVHCGRDVVPGLGLEGEYVAGLAAADALGRMAGRSWI
ncbi:MAG: NAD(P)-binding protein [Myxococcota bacterium]